MDADKEKQNNKNEKRYLQKMKENLVKREKNKKSIFPLKNIDLFSMFMKKQNENLLRKIAQEKFRNKDDQEDFINKYLKINYYIPDIVEDIEDESCQKYIC
tara:strand:- start:9 stop:311 length:303 start_codon:yes stop_codon:yes gene_type:complete